jgi:site-specific DNA recombinase
VSAAAQAMLADRAAIALALEGSEIADHQLESIFKSAQRWIERLRGSDAALALSELTERVELNRKGLQFFLKLPVPSQGADDGPASDHLSLVKFVPLEMQRRGVEMKMVLEGDKTPNRVDLPLLKAVARSRKWTDDLVSGRVESVDALAKQEGLDKRSVRRLIRLGFLSPRIVEAIAEGRQPPDLTVIALVRRLDLPVLWSAQEQTLGIRVERKSDRVA